MTDSRPRSTTFSRVAIDQTRRCRRTRATARPRSPAPPAAGPPRTSTCGRPAAGAGGPRPRTPPNGDQQEHHDGGSGPGVVGQEVGEVELRHVDPPLLRQLDEDPDEGGDADPPAQPPPRGPPPGADGLVGDEEVLEGVREDQQQCARLGQLERDHADQPVEVQEPGDPVGRHARPVAQGRQVGHRQVVDVHGLVVALVARGVEAERLEDRLVGGIEHQARDDRRQRELRDQQRDQEPGADDDDEHEGLCQCS